MSKEKCKHKWIKVKNPFPYEKYSECEKCEAVKLKEYEDDSKHDLKLVVNYTPNK